MAMKQKVPKVRLSIEDSTVGQELVRPIKPSLYRPCCRIFPDHFNHVCSGQSVHLKTEDMIQLCLDIAMPILLLHIGEINLVGPDVRQGEVRKP